MSQDRRRGSGRVDLDEVGGEARRDIVWLLNGLREVRGSLVAIKDGCKVKAKRKEQRQDLDTAGLVGESLWGRAKL